MQLLVIHFTIKMFHIGFMQVLILYRLSEDDTIVSKHVGL